MRFVLVLFSLLYLVPASADTLQDVVSARLKELGSVPRIESERTWAASGYNPIQYFEYRYGRSGEDNKRYYRVPWANEGGENHTLRVHIKSFTEIINSSASRQLSQDLLGAEQRESVNQRQFDAYLDVVQHNLQARMHKLLGGREADLQRSVETSGQMLGLPKVNVKDLVRELENLQRVDAELQGLKALRNTTASLSDGQAMEVATALIEAVGTLAKKISDVNWSGEKLRIERKRLEARLSRIDKEISWAQDRKWIDHVDFQRDTLEREDTFRIGFNLPFLRFDNENRARDKALLAAKESALERDASELRIQLRRKQAEILSLAAQVESMKSRLHRTRGIADKVKNVRDVELRAVLGDFSFELERDLVLQAQKFYTAYLEFLRDQGAFAVYAGHNLLKPNWPELTE